MILNFNLFSRRALQFYVLVDTHHACRGVAGVILGWIRTGENSNMNKKLTVGTLLLICLLLLAVAGCMVEDAVSYSRDVKPIIQNNCLSCHELDAPAYHYPGECSICHTTTAWQPASYDHASEMAWNCQSCHAPPIDHYGGQCSGCHTTVNWAFVHTIGINCQACHSPPGDHPSTSAQCSECHNTLDWDDAEGDDDHEDDDD